MMRLGAYNFSLDTAAYRDFQRTAEWVWAALPRFGQDDELQSTGPGPETIKLAGVIFPEFKGGTGQLDALRSLADERQPQALIDGRGRMLGDWVILRVDERGGIFGPAGVALRQEFDIDLRRAPRQAGGGLFGSLAAVIAATPLPVAGLLASAKEVTMIAAKGPEGLLAGLNGSLSTLTGMASVLGGQASNVLGAVRTGINSARTLQNAGQDAARLLASAKNLTNLPSVMNGLVTAGGNVSRAAGAASGVLDLARSGITDITASRAVQDAMITTNKLNVMAVQVRTAAESVRGRG
jgi:phage protein U